MEETEKPRYPKDLNVGRILIEEIPEEKNDVEKHPIVKRDEIKPRRGDTEPGYNVDTVCRKQVQQDLVKVGRLDISDYEKTPRESRQIEERTTTYAPEFEKHHRVSFCTKMEIKCKIRRKVYVYYYFKPGHCCVPDIQTLAQGEIFHIICNTC